MAKTFQGLPELQIANKHPNDLLEAHASYSYDGKKMLCLCVLDLDGRHLAVYKEDTA